VIPMPVRGSLAVDWVAMAPTVPLPAVRMPTGTAPWTATGPTRPPARPVPHGGRHVEPAPADAGQAPRGLPRRYGLGGAARTTDPSTPNGYRWFATPRETGP